MKKQNYLFSVLLAATFSFTTFGFANSSFASSVHPVKNPDPSLIDAHVKPCDDFYQYACGKWIAKAKIPADKPAWDRSFTAIHDRNQKILHKILLDYAAGKFKPANPYAKQLGDLYSSCMNSPKQGSASLKLLKARLQDLDKMTKESLPAQLAWLHMRDFSGFFNLYETQDLKHPEQVIAEVSQGGMGLPTKDYYFSKSKRMVAIRAQYVDYIGRLFQLAGEKAKQAKSDAAAVMKFETAMAKSALLPVQFRDPTKLYHKFEFSKLNDLSPAFKWDAYLTGLGVAEKGSLNIATPDFLKATLQLIGTTPIETLRAYLKFHLINGSVKGLPDRFEDASFKFYGKAFYGMKKLPVRWKRCVNAADGFMGFALDRSFVELTFSGPSKKMAQDLIQSVEESLKQRLESVDWMDTQTRTRALAKFKKLFNQIGYPDKWRSYNGVKVTRGSYLANRYAISDFNNQYELAKIGKPLDRSEWGMVPSEVNAYYDSSLNKMVFPAGILQAPFFNANYPLYSKYGGIGMVMGHEMTHGYDDEGRHFDGNGAMTDWWTAKSEKSFKERAECLASQYNSFKTAGGGHVDGHLTLGEDIADQGGMMLSFAAWQRTLPKNVKQNPTELRKEEQNYFLAFAQSWCSKETAAFEQLEVHSDPHPPSRYRVNGVLTNFAPFAEAYQCSTGSKMAPAHRCVVW